MTAEEHDTAYTKTFEEGELLRGYIQCDAIAQRLARRFPEDPFVWSGTVSERLAYLAFLLTGDFDSFKDMCKKTQPSAYDPFDGKAGKAIKYPTTTTISLKETKQ